MSLDNKGFIVMIIFSRGKSPGEPVRTFSSTAERSHKRVKDGASQHDGKQEVKHLDVRKGFADGRQRDQLLLKNVSFFWGTHNPSHPMGRYVFRKSGIKPQL